MHICIVVYTYIHTYIYIFNWFFVLVSYCTMNSKSLTTSCFDVMQPHLGWRSLLTGIIYIFNYACLYVFMCLLCVRNVHLQWLHCKYPCILGRKSCVWLHVWRASLEAFWQLSVRTKDSYMYVCIYVCMYVCSNNPYMHFVTQLRQSPRGIMITCGCLGIHTII